jgi:hypothetical protein
MVGTLAFLAGLAGVVLTVISSRVHADLPALAAGLTVSVNRTGELDVAPAGTVISASDLRAGARRHVTLRVRNQTGVPVGLQIRAQPRTGALDDVLALVVRARDRTIAEGSLRRLRRWSPVTLTLGPGRTAEVTVGTTLTRVPEGRGARDDITLELRARARDAAP